MQLRNGSQLIFPHIHKWFMNSTFRSELEEKNSESQSEYSININYWKAFWFIVEWCENNYNFLFDRKTFSAKVKNFMFRN